jgi:hypothetical protein
MIKNAALFSIIALLCVGGNIYSQEFGFGFDDEISDNSSALPFPVKIGGEIEANLLGYVHDFASEEKLKKTNLGDMVSGNLSFSASGTNVDAFIGLNLSAKSFNDLAHITAQTPLILNEAYLRAFFGPINIEAGYRKMFWGKADSMGPLDVINPLDYSDLTNITDLMAMKIARPLVHVTWNMSGFSKLEAVFVPNFAGHRFDQTGRWIPSQFSSIPDTIRSEMTARIPGKFTSMPDLLFLLSNQNKLEEKLMDYFSSTPIAGPDTAGLEYFQTGIRFTTAIRGVDLGVQYYYGYQPRPSWSLDSGIDAFLDDIKNNLSSPPAVDDLDKIDPSKLYPSIGYDRYHQIGVDYAQVVFGFNIRAEFAAHITADLSGSNGAVKNPFLAWSFGFDREIIAGISANIQCNETIRLLNNKINTNPALDFEAGTPMTSTRLTMQVSKNFLKDSLVTKVTAIWGIEDNDCYIIPSVAWTIKDVKAELCAGIFAGKETGELGQYWENSFIKLGLTYSF